MARTIVSRRTFLAGLGGAAALALAPTAGRVAAQPAADANVINDWNTTSIAVITSTPARPTPRASSTSGSCRPPSTTPSSASPAATSLYKSNARPGPSGLAAGRRRRRRPPGADDLLRPRAGRGDAADRRLRGLDRRAPGRPATRQGIQYGRQTAERFIALRAEDGRYGPNTFDMAPAPGIWRPTPPANAPFFAKFLCETTPLHDRVAQPVPAGPAARHDLARLRGRLRGGEGVRLEGGLRADAVADGDGAVHLEHRPGAVPCGAARPRRPHGMDISDRARLFAAVNMSVADAIIAVWDSKVHYGLWRPITAIQLAEEDGNPATTADPAWDSLDPEPALPRLHQRPQRGDRLHARAR